MTIRTSALSDRFRVTGLRPMGDSAKFTGNRADPEFGLRVVAVGVAVTLVLAAASLGYAVLTWDRPHRVVLAVISLVATLDAVTIHLLRHRLVCSGRLDMLFSGWNV